MTWWLGISKWWAAKLWPFLKKNWLWCVNGILVLLGILFAADKLTPDKVIKPELPDEDKKAREEAVNDHADAVVDVKEKLKDVSDNQRKHESKIDEVIATPSDTVDEAVDNWNKER